jgi:ribosomal protein S18 acetylase RimI-like enzyme
MAQQKTTKSSISMNYRRREFSSSSTILSNRWLKFTKQEQQQRRRRRNGEYSSSLTVLLALFVLFQCQIFGITTWSGSGSTAVLVEAFTVSYGIGATFFQPKGLITQPSGGEPQALLDASDMFVDAFWIGKVGGGAATLDDKQKRSLSSTQFAEFRARYAGVRRGQSELVLCKLPNGEIVGCAGIEVSPIPEDNLKGQTMDRAPLMSNVAVSKKYRRKGIAETLVKEVERLSRYEWGYNDVYLYVEERNTSALKLYQKLGYRKVWVDKDAKTLLPASNGKLKSADTKIVCMKKRMDLGLFGRIWPLQ